MLRRFGVRLQVYGVAVLMTGAESSKALPETAENRSSRSRAAGGRFKGLSPLWIAVLAMGVIGALLMIGAEFATLRSVKVLTASCSDLADPSLRSSCVTHGGEEHSYALVLIGIAALVMVWGAVFGRSRPAGAALALLGAAVVLIALLTDLPDIHKTGVLGDRFESAHATAGPALWMEIAGGALVLAAGVICLAAPRPRVKRR
jgi:hypothetical protein